MERKENLPQFEMMFSSLFQNSLGILLEKLKSRSCERARFFYEELKWRTSEEIRLDSYPPVNFDFLGSGCVERKVIVEEETDY